MFVCKFVYEPRTSHIQKVQEREFVSYVSFRSFLDLMITHQEPLCVGSKVVDTSYLARTSTLKMETARPPKLWLGTWTQKTTTSISLPWKPRVTS